jgi:RNA polymerase sigma-70 factor (ECF subfamily)
VITNATEFCRPSVQAKEWLAALAVFAADGDGDRLKPAKSMDEVDHADPAENPAEQADIKAARNGDGGAYARIIRRHQQTLARRMVRFTRNPREIEELVHDVFVEAYFSLKNYRGDAPLEHWLTRIATRVGYRYWKNRRVDRERTLVLASLAPQSQNDASKKYESAEHAAAVLAVVLDELPPRDRLVVTLLYLENRGVAEAADLAGWSRVMVKVQAHRARAKLRKALEKHGLGTAS